MLKVALLFETLETVNSNLREELDTVDVKTNLSPEANPCPEIEMLELRVTEIVAGIETPVSLKVSVGVGSSPPPLEHPTTSMRLNIKKLNNELILFNTFILNQDK